MEQGVFICYGREDLEPARRLFLDLRSAGLKPWLDHECLQAGHRWKAAIRQAIHQSRFFIALLSSKTTERKGFRNAEIREALEILRDYPESDTFFIPARLDNCEMPQAELWELQRVDLFPDWDMGVGRILKALAFSHQPLTAFIAIQCRRLDAHAFTQVFTLTDGKELVVPGYEKPHINVAGNPLLEFLSSNEHVEEIHWIHGDFDILAVVKVPTIVAVGEMLESIRRLPGVLNTSTTTSMGRYR